MDEARRIWRPTCRRPADLVRPVRIDASGRSGPTRRQAQGPRWEAAAPRWFVPADRARCVEQRIVEQAARLGPSGAVTGWAALRWQGAAYFDGAGPGGTDVEPVPLLLGGGNLRPAPGAVLSKAQLAPSDVLVVDGLRVTRPLRALYDEIVRRRPDLWQAVAAADMTAAAGLLTAAELGEHLTHLPAWEGLPFARRVRRLTRDDLRSPREAWLDLVWRLVADLAPALANRAVFGLDGTFLAMPDLLDPDAGLAVEYDGVHHLAHEQRRHDVGREERLRSHGLEYVSVVRGDSRDEAARRILAARSRASFLPPHARAWTLDPPPGWRHPW